MAPILAALSSFKAISLSSMITERDIDVLALTETWLGSAVDQQVLGELVPLGYNVISIPRPGAKRGGGTAVIYKAGLLVSLVSSSQDKPYTQFEHMECLLSSKDHGIRLCVVYRPPPCTKNGLRIADFFEE